MSRPPSSPLPTTFARSMMSAPPPPIVALSHRTSFGNCSMHSRAVELLNALGMRQHPEGGHYIEVFRSAHRVRLLDRDVERAALTAIYFLLAAGEYSRWHRVLSDEVWHYHEGDALELILFDEAGLRRLRLGRVSREKGPSIVVSAGTWQAAGSQGEDTLCGCTVGTGFEFAEFSVVMDFTEVSE